MGLAICRAIVGAHGGVIDIEKNSAHGVTFFVALPVLPSKEKDFSVVN